MNALISVIVVLSVRGVFGVGVIWGIGQACVGVCMCGRCGCVWFHTSECLLG